jgi:hypothetical protein
VVPDADQLARIETRLTNLETLLSMIIADPDPSYYGTIALPRWLGGEIPIRLEPVQPKRS